MQRSTQIEGRRMTTQINNDERQIHEHSRWCPRRGSPSSLICTCDPPPIHRPGCFSFKKDRDEGYCNCGVAGYRDSAIFGDLELEEPVDVIVVSSEGREEENEIYVWNSEIPFTTEMKNQNLSGQFKILCDGIEYHRVLWCVTGNNGMIKQVTVDDDGKAVETDKGIKTKILRGFVEVK